MPWAAVHHRIADVEFGQVLDQRFDVADLLLLLAPARRGAGREQLGLGDEIDAFLEPGKAGGQRRGGDADFFVAGAGTPASESKAGRRQAAGAQEVQQALAPAVAFGQHQHALRACCGCGP